MNNNKRTAQNIALCLLFLLVVLRDANIIALPIIFYTIYCFFVMPFLNNSELIGLGVSMTVYNHALQINYILIGITVVLFLKNIKIVRNFNKVSALLLCLIILEGFHALGSNTAWYSISDYFRWLCMPFFIAFSLAVANENAERTLSIFINSTLIAMFDILLQYLRYEGWILASIFSSRFRFGNSYLYNNELEYCVYDNENSVAFFALAAICACVILYLKTKKKIYILKSAVLLLFGLLTQSRAFVLSIIVFLTIFLFYLLKEMKISRKGLLIIFGSVLIAVTILYFLRNQLFILINSINSRFAATNLYSDRSSLFVEYLNYWLSSIRVFLFGIGTQKIDVITGITNTTHNGLVDILICFGISGLFIMVCHWVLFFRKLNFRELKWAHFASLLAFFIEYNTLQYVRVPALFGLSLVLYLILKIYIPHNMLEEV